MIRLLFFLVVVAAVVIIVSRIVGSLLRFPVNSRRGDSERVRSARRGVAQSAAERERHYRAVLGVPSAAGEQEIKAAYRAQLAKYHPDKVAHLGGEFSELASSRTREIVEAYDFLKNKYGFQ